MHRSKSQTSSSTKPRVAIAIMAAGKGTRLQSKHPKVLNEVGGKSLLAHVIAAAQQVVSPQDIFAIIGYQAERVRSSVKGRGVQFVVQEPQRGTGHAIMCARSALAGYDHVIVLSGDAPLITSATITKLRDFHLQHKPAMTILSAELEDPTGYGRLIRKGRGEVQAVVEEKSCTPAQRKLREINSGFYAFAVQPLFTYIVVLKTDNPHAEYYLTDMAGVFRKAKQKVLAVKAADPAEILGSNTRAELVDLDRKMRREKSMQLMSSGVTIFYPETCVIDADVKVGADTTIEPFVQLLGRTRNYDGVNKHKTIIEDNVFVGSDATLVAPVKLGKGSYVGAASCITEDVPTDSLAIGRSKQIIKEGWAKQKRSRIAIKSS